MMDTDYQPSFSKRLWQVLALIAAGKSNKQIAAELSLSVKTVDCHVSSILQELGMRNRTQAANWFNENGKNR